MNHKLDNDYSINQYDMIIIDSYSFHCFIVSIVKVPHIKEFEYGLFLLHLWGERIINNTISDNSVGIEISWDPMLEECFIWYPSENEIIENNEFMRDFFQLFP